MDAQAIEALRARTPTLTTLTPVGPSALHASAFVPAAVFALFLAWRNFLTWTASNRRTVLQALMCLGVLVMSILGQLAYRAFTLQAHRHRMEVVAVWDLLQERRRFTPAEHELLKLYAVHPLYNAVVVPLSASAPEPVSRAGRVGLSRHVLLPLQQEVRARIIEHAEIPESLRDALRAEMPTIETPSTP